MWNKIVGFFIGLAVGFALIGVSQDWYEATGKPVQRGTVNSADLRTEFALIESDIAGKLPALLGNSSKLVRVNSAATALEAFTPPSGTFDVLLDDACTTTPSMTVDWRQVDNLVILQQVGGSLTCTNNSANMSATVAAVPTSIRPNTAVRVTAHACTNSATTATCMVQINANGTVDISPVSGGWGGGTTVGPPTNWTVAYILGNP